MACAWRATSTGPHNSRGLPGRPRDARSMEKRSERFDKGAANWNSPRAWRHCPALVEGWMDCGCRCVPCHVGQQHKHFQRRSGAEMNYVLIGCGVALLIVLGIAIYGIIDTTRELRRK